MSFTLFLFLSTQDVLLRKSKFSEHRTEKDRTELGRKMTYYSIVLASQQGSTQRAPNGRPKGGLRARS